MSGFVVLAIIVVLLVAWASSASARQQEGGRRFHGRPCPTCGTGHPAFAQFCRHCGRRLP